VHDRLRGHLLWSVLCLSRHTITGLLYTGEAQFDDWSADYRLYSRGRVDPDLLFAMVLQEVQALLPPAAPLVVAMDDSILRKTGKKTPGVAWRVDPAGPAFQVNFVLGRRVLQLSAAVPFGDKGEARSIPIDFVDAPTAKKPGKKATDEQKQQYREQQRQKNINTVGLARVKALAAQSHRELWLTVDGRFTNRSILKQLPEGVRLIGRFRADASLYAVPLAECVGPQGGRPRRYGSKLPTPEELLKDTSIPCQEVQGYAAGKVHQFKIKTLNQVKWKPAGAGQILRLIVIAPLGYKLSKEGKLLYRQPAYLICNDPSLSLEQVLQAYLWRWGVEVNFRDEKSVRGVGQDQVRHEKSVGRVPACAVAAYSLLLLAGIHAYGPAGVPQELPEPRWMRGRRPRLCPTQRLISQLRLECWGSQFTRQGFEGFSVGSRSARGSGRTQNQKPSKPRTPLASAVLYARNA
jgi:hypothetical protein